MLEQVQAQQPIQIHSRAVLAVEQEKDNFNQDPRNNILGSFKIVLISKTNIDL